MDRRAFLYGLTIGTVTTPLAAGYGAQQAGKAYKIGILWFGREPPVPPSLGVFAQSLADSGYVEGKNLSFLHRWSEVSTRFPYHVAELVHLNVDVLVAANSPAIQAAVTTKTIPVVIISVGDPIEAGVITSLSRPGGNVTGLSARADELSAKLLEVLKESLPRSSRIAVMGGISVRLQRTEMEVAARSLRTQLQFMGAHAVARDAAGGVGGVEARGAYSRPIAEGRWMARMISIHEYDLRSGSGAERFGQAIRAAEARGLFELPGLTAHHFVKGVKGARNDAYAAVWVYESREAWEHLWGPPDRPRQREDYPEKWRIWEDDLLAPILISHPDAIRFTAYEELSLSA